MNPKRKFDDIQKRKLGNYIYALRDPRDRKIFYVGQGINDRVFSHFNEADIILKKEILPKNIKSKILRIIDIWNLGENVDWIILAHGIPKFEEPKLVDYIESSIVDTLLESQNGETLNENSPPKSSKLLPEQIKSLGAKNVTPKIKIKSVFVFPIQNELDKGVDPYNATRKYWSIGKEYLKTKPSFAVGLKNYISSACFQIKEWKKDKSKGKYEFFEKADSASEEIKELQNKNWNAIISKSLGYWQRGNFLIVEFDGKGKFRIIRGAKDKKWHEC